MPAFRICAAAALGLAAAPALAEMDFVTDPALCGLDLIERHERGMSFDGRFFSEIEYYCALAEPLPRPDWQSNATHISAGYCEEPGALFPGVFVLQTFQTEPGRLYVWQDDSGEAATYHLCEG
ncbi:MAG: hypothetical protein RIG84_10950 [Roseovarius sp.]